MGRESTIAELTRLRELNEAQGNTATVAAIDAALARLRAEATPPAERAQTR